MAIDIERKLENLEKTHPHCHLLATRLQYLPSPGGQPSKHEPGSTSYLLTKGSEFKLQLW